MTTKLSRGQRVFLVRPKRMLAATVIAAYDWPAVRVKFRGDELIVGRGEIVAAADHEARQAEARLEALKLKHADIIAQWKPGMTSAEWAAGNGGWNIGQWQVIRQLKRAGVLA